MVKYNVNGNHYEVQYREDLSQRDYTQKAVYDITTTQENKATAKDEICNILMADGSWPKDHYQTVNRLHPCMQNSLHSYHSLSYNEATETYRYEVVRPYDD